MMIISDRIQELVSEWQHGGSDGPSWDDLLHKLAVEIRDEAIAEAILQGSHETALAIARRIK